MKTFPDESNATLHGADSANLVATTLGICDISCEYRYMKGAKPVPAMVVIRPVLAVTLLIT